LHLQTTIIIAASVAIRSAASGPDTPIAAVHPPWDALFNCSQFSFQKYFKGIESARGSGFWEAEDRAAVMARKSVDWRLPRAEGAGSEIEWESRRVLRRTPTCETSTMSGYSNMVDLSGNGYMLHWTTTSRDTLKLAVEETSTTGAGGGGWLMVAWARKGFLFPSDAVFGNLFGRRTVAAFTISGPGAEGASPAAFTLGRTAFSVSFNKAVMKFSRKRADGSVPVDYYGKNKLLWAFTTDTRANPTLPPFYRGISVVDFSCAADGDGTPAPSDDYISPPPPTRTPSPPPSSSCLGSRKPSCSASSLPGFTSMVDLGKGLTLHWKLLSTTSASFALQAKSGTAAAAAGGWISVGWSKGGSMYPADAVVGAAGGDARTYAISSYSSVVLTTRFGISGGSVGSGFNGVLLKFTRSGVAGVAPVAYLSSNRIVWAFSASGSSTVGSHGSNRGSKTIDLSCNAMCA
ncbi:hypothetical protein CLOM_g12310, partial [Closterium sp. NIES-68]